MTSFKKIKELYKIAHVGDIARRYFAMNSFDGILTILGILIGSYFSHVEVPSIIVGASLGAAAAMGVSGTWGTYMTESAERKRSLMELEKHTLTNLKKSRIGRAERFGAVFIAMIDGLSPFVAGIIVIIPFFIKTLPIHTMYLSSVIIAFSLLFVLGIYLGRIAKENIVLSGLKMLLAGVVAAVIGWLLTR